MFHVSNQNLKKKKKTLVHDWFIPKVIRSTTRSKKTSPVDGQAERTPLHHHGLHETLILTQRRYYSHLGCYIAGTRKAEKADGWKGRKYKKRGKGGETV